MNNSHTSSHTVDHTHSKPPNPSEAATDAVQLEQAFRTLADRWRKETGMLSSFSKIIEHPAYQEIIEMGEPAVPLILRELRDRPAHWFDALRVITNQSPVPAPDRSNPKKAREAWLKWGKDRGYIE